MITQKLISFKIDSSLLDSLDLTIAELPINRNKFINYCLKFGLETIQMQLDIAKSKHLSTDNLPFLSNY